jgi:hypothetical protein
MVTLVAAVGHADVQGARAARQGHGRAEPYHGVWSALRRLTTR